MATFISLFAIAILCFIISGASFAEEESSAYGIFICIVGLILIMIAVSATIDYGKKQGQIDAITGDVYYELKTNPDSTREWVYIKEK